MKYFVSISIKNNGSVFRVVEANHVTDAQLAVLGTIPVNSLQVPFTWKFNYCQPMEGRDATSPVLPIMKSLRLDAEHLKAKGDPLWEVAQSLYEGMHDEFCSRV